MTRMYVPTTVSRLRGLVTAAEVPLDGALSVDDEQRRALPDWSEDDLEYLVLQDAAQLAVHLIARESDGSALRAVIAVDVPSGSGGPVAWTAVASVHLDAPDAEPAVRAATAAIGRGEAAETELDAISEVDLAWFAPREIPFVLDDLASGRSIGEL